MYKGFFLAAISIVLLSPPALADTRDDVWAAMQRCQSIPDDRTWLDCTYGAKQPMRAKLGLQPAPEYQQRLVPPAPLASSAESAPRRTPPSAQPQRRGSFLQILGGNAPPVTVSTVAAVRYDSQGAFILTLQNGQVWHQVNADTNARVHLTVGVRATVTEGALWSYKLQTSDNPHVYKVERKT